MPILFLSPSQTQPNFLLICFIEKHNDAPGHAFTKNNAFLRKLDRLKHTNGKLEMELCGCCSRTGFLTFQALSLQAAALPGVVVIQGQDPAPGLVEPHVTGHQCSLSRTLQVPALQHIDVPAPLGGGWGKEQPTRSEHRKESVCKSETHKGLVTSLVLNCRTPDDCVRVLVKDK